MSELIEQLDEKYLVLKLNDVSKYLNEPEKDMLSVVLHKIRIGRLKDGKSGFDRYVVLNLDDKFSVSYLLASIEELDNKFELDNRKEMKIKDIAVDLVNSILIRK